MSSAIRWRPNVYFLQENNLAAPVAELPAAADAPAVAAAAPAVTADPAQQQMAMVAALPPEIIATLIALAQAAGSLPMPADSNPTTTEASGKAKRKPAGAAGAAEQAGAASRKAKKPKEERSQNETAKPRQIKEGRSDKETAESRKIKEELSREEAAMAGVLRRRGSKGGRQSNFTLEQQATVVKICLSEFGFPTRHDWHTRLGQKWETVKQENPSLLGLPPPAYNQIYKWLKHHCSDSEPSAPPQDTKPSSDSTLCCDAEMVRVPPPKIPDVVASDPVGSGEAAGIAVLEEVKPFGTANPDDAMLARLLDASAEVESQSRLSPVQIDQSASKAKSVHVPSSVLLAIEKGSAYFRKHGCEKLELVSAGSYGHVFALAGADGNRLGSVMKVFTLPFSRRTSLKYMAVEVEAMRLSHTLENLSTAQERGAIQRCGFAARPADGSVGGPSGLVFLPIEPCADRGHAAIFMEEAARPLEELLKALASMYFSDKDGALHRAAMPHLATVVRSVVHNLYWMGRCGIAHGDLKGLNVMLSYKLRGGPESILRDETGRKAVPLLIDFGNATLPGMHHVWAKEEDLRHYDPTTETFGKEPVYLTPAAKGGATPRAQKLLADSQGEARTVPRLAPRSFYQDIHEYSLKELHVHTATVPSSMPADEPPPWPVAAVKSWGGTEGYIPPEGNHKPPDGTSIKSTDRIPGDMYALGIMLLRALSGYDNNTRVPQDRADKKSLCEAEPPCLWCTYLMKNVRSKSEDPIPDEWKEAVEFLKDTLTLRPDKRLTPAQALQHPFIKLAERFRSDEIPVAPGKSRRARG